MLSLNPRGLIGYRATVLIYKGPEKEKRTRMGPTKNVKIPGSPVGIRDRLLFF